jgi:hypothetical protein
MTCFVAVAEVSNAWVVFHSLKTADDYAKEELRDLIKKNGGEIYGNLVINFEGGEVNQLDKLLWKLFDKLHRYKISNNVFNITERALGKIISDFLDEAMECGLIGVHPFQNFIRKTTSRECLKRIQANRKNRDIEIYNKYLPAILQARKLFSNPQVVKNVQDIVNRIYINPKHTLKCGLFDSEGRRISKLYYSWHEWYDLGAVGTSLMVAIGAFGFKSHNAVLFLAFDRIKGRLSSLEGRNDWRNIDNMLPDLLSRKLDLIHLFSRMKQKRLLKGWQLIEAAPLASLIPGDGLHLFKDSMDEDMGYMLEHFYPRLRYVLID